LKRIRYLTIRFDAELARHEITAFRGAIANAVGPQHTLFHNHDDRESGGVIYRYPAIQYKRIGRNPLLVCIEEGVDEIHHLFQKQSWELNLNGRPLTLSVADLRLNQYTLQAWEQQFRFQLTDWLALNRSNYEQYQQLTSEPDQLDLLERILRGNILSMAKGLDWHIDREVRVRITHLSPMRRQRYKDQLLSCFDAEFTTNVFLPDWIGLGKGVSIGFGVVKAVRSRNGSASETQQHPTIIR
jgi:hypothetical protein